ncbi:hypothetical protein [Burkholderia gladioli]|uniref:hypothetical protein n=1 Tax=Burkholderia gladioli TaxID=28095 RepID=UPI00163FF1E4|nr:hypothetical protein [Burkholderia gladioli]
MMRKFVVSIAALAACHLAHAQASPAVGIWEQLSVASAQGDHARQRRDFVFTNQKLDEDTVFSGLVDVGTRAAVVCCVKVQKGAALTLTQLLQKYQWEDDDVAHLKSITGAKYIYEARVVNDAEQNARMRKLVKSLNMPPPLSPYSAAVIAGKLSAVELDKHFTVGTAAITFSTRSLRGGDALAYQFSVNGSALTLTEQNYPD